MTTVIQQLAHERRRLGIAPEAVAEMAGILVMDVGRIEQGGNRLRLDHVVGYAAALGLRLSLAKDPRIVGEEDRMPLGVGEVPRLLDLLRADFEDCRKSLRQTPSEFARSCGITAKAVFALERGPQIPWLASAIVHAGRFGLEIVLVPASEPAVDGGVGSFARFIPNPSAEDRPSGSYYVKSPRSEDEGRIADVLVRAFSGSRLSARQLASRIGVNWKTIAPGGTPSFTGRFSTVEKVAEVLGYRILAVPREIDVDVSAGGDLGHVVDEPQGGTAMAQGISHRFAQARRQRGTSAAKMAETGFNSRTTVRLEANASSATLSTLCAQAEALGLRIVAIPAHVAERVENAAWSKAAVRPAPRRRSAPVGFDEAMDGYKRRIMTRLFEDIDLVCPRSSSSDIARALDLTVDAAEKLQDGRRYRARMSEVAGLLNLRGARLVVGGAGTGFHLEFGNAEPFEASLEAFVDLGIVHRQAQGLSAGAAGRVAGVSDKRIEAVEALDARILASSVLIYADALGLPWRIVGPSEAAPLRSRQQFEEARL